MLFIFIFFASFNTSPFFMCKSLGFLGFLGCFVKALWAFFACKALELGFTLPRECLHLPSPAWDVLASPELELARQSVAMSESELSGIEDEEIKSPGIQSSQKTSMPKCIENKGTQNCCKHNYVMHENLLNSLCQVVDTLPNICNSFHCCILFNY